MKRVVLAAVVLFSVFSFAAPVKNVSSVVLYKSGDGRHISASQVPAPVMESFNSKYPGATNVQWEVEREHGSRVYQAEFTYNGRRLKAEFAPDGTFLGQKRA